ncbi:uncharacterized protein LOC129769317 [Toxorhynchites rutilus septentrionalis]|uniref:uncharacterized protein LOC129769317 n=1 Tax=Toxorhynchites rutilus septentrionalis TaxID=329112 RepID=UPI0024796F9F|nr:uncharacterized protein LOC129769317 [Toxorhynchites rutilus septentrionalis]
MTRGGRGYPRGGGSRGGGSYRGGGGGYRSSNHGGSGGYDGGRDNSRNRYSVGGNSYGDSRSSRYDNNRYSRQDNRQDGNYKRNDSYKDSRDRRSPDRKRPRTDHSNQGGRRDYNATGGSGDYRRDSAGGSGRGGSSSRYHDTSSSSYDKRGNDHHSSSSVGGSGTSSRDRFENRSSSRGRGAGDKSRESMGPPRSVAPRSSNVRGPPLRTTLGSRPSIPLSMRRGPIRGRIPNRFRTDSRRGIMNSRFNSRRDIRGPVPMRRRFPPIRSRDGIGRIGKRTMDTTTRVSRKALIKRALEAAKELDDEHTTENEGDDDEVDEDKDVTEGEGDDIKKEIKEGEVDDDDKTEKEEDDDEDDADKTIDKADDDKEDDEKADESKDGEDGDEGKKDASATPKKSTKKAPAKVKSSPNADKTDDKDGEKQKKDTTKITTKYRSSPFIKLNCCHCGTKCFTFKEYHSHLFRGLHRSAMRRLAGTTRDKLAEMRHAQRVAQKEEDEKVEDFSEQKSSYCPLCQLNFRQPKAVHQKSDGHKQMKRFLMPYCTTCKIGFKSPMAFEAHRSSIEHLKFKARVERYASKDEDGDDGAEIDLENFTTVDEVGNVDEPTDTSKENTSTPKKSGSADNKSTGRPGTDDEDDDDSDDVDGETVIGSEHVKKVEVQFCDLCDMYLPRRDEQEKVLRTHCKTRSHLRLYIRNREDKKLRERAERIHKKKITDAKARKDAKKEKDASNASEADAAVKEEPSAEKKSGEEGETKDAAATDDQMWEVVDNDLGDLLREVAGPAEDNEEEEDDEKTSSERYDKFKHTEKNGLDQSSIHDTTVDEDEDSTTEKKAAANKKPANGDATSADKEVKAEA